MKIKLLIGLCIITLFGVSACTTPDIVISPKLKSEAQIYEVSGKQGWQFKQVIKFGPYKTSKVKRGWTSASGSKFIHLIQNTEQKLSFTQYTPTDSAKVFAISEFSSKDFILFGDFFEVPIYRKNIFSGEITLSNNQTWRFIISDPDGLPPIVNIEDLNKLEENQRNTKCGEIINNCSKSIEIYAVREIEGQMYPFGSFENFGFEFKRDGISIGAVSTVNNGRVWIKNGLDKETELLLSSLNSCLILRHDIQDPLED
jgi:hypothetical protein